MGVSATAGLGVGLGMSLGLTAASAAGIGATAGSAAGVGTIPGTQPIDWAADLQAAALTLKLALVVTLLLLALGTPLAWWLARTRSRWKAPLSALVALPLVLPPTVIGFYLLLLLGPHGAVGRAMQALGLDLLPFSFGGLVLASMLYSLPFVVQPIQAAFEAIGARPMEAAATLRAGPWARFAQVGLPLARRGVLAAAVLGFAHTVGEFGVVLMIGGNIPGATRVVSTQLYSHVEALEYPAAHRLAAALLAFSFAVLWGVYRLQPRGGLPGAHALPPGAAPPWQASHPSQTSQLSKPSKPSRQ